MDRERFIGPVFRFGQYEMSVLRHDEGENARSYDLDREAWVMLLGFPEDLKNSADIAKVVSCFGIMMHWHEPENLARVVVKVYLNNDAKLPESVKVNAGVPPKGKSWTVPCYILKRHGVPELQDEEAFVTTSPLHPRPPEYQRWMGLVPPAGSDATPVGYNNANEMQVEGADTGNRWQQQSAPLGEFQSLSQIPNKFVAAAVMGPTILPDAVLNKAQLGDTSATHPKSGSNLLELAAAIAPRMKSVVVGPSAFISCPQLGGNTLEKLALEYLDEEEEDAEMVVANVSEGEDQDIDMEEKTNSDLEMLHDAPSVFKTLKEKGVVKVKEQIDDDFLRRSKRIS